MDPVVIQCPACGVKLKLTDPSVIGRKAACPKCKQPFVLKAPPQPEEPSGPQSEVAAAGASDAAPGQTLDASPPAIDTESRPLATRRTPKQAGQSNRKRLALVAGCGLLGVVLISGLVWVVVGGLSGSGSGGRLDLAYLPPDAEVVVSYRLADAWKAPILEPLVNHPRVREGVDEMRNRVGLGPADVESVLIGVSGLSRAQGQAANPTEPSGIGGGMLPLQIPEGASVLGVIHTSRPFDKQKLLEYAQESENIRIDEVHEAAYQGEVYYRFADPRNRGLGLMAAFFPDDQTIVIGPEAEVKSAIQRGGDTEPRRDLEFLDLDQHLLIAVVPEDPGALGKSSWRPSADTPESVRRLREALNDSVRGYSFGLTFTEGIDFQVQLDCLDGAKSEQIKVLMSDAIVDFRNEFGEKLAEAKVTAPSPLLAELVAVGEQILESVRAEGSGTTVAVTAALPGSARETFAKIPDAIASVFQPPGALTKPGEGDAGGLAVAARREQRPPEPLTGVSLDEFNAGWQVQLDVQGQPAGELLKKLAEELDIALKPLPGQEGALSQPVTLKLEDGSRLEAIDEICRAIGLHPQFPRSSFGTMTLRKGPRRWPSTFAGPFLVEVTGLEESVPNATGTLKIRVVSAGLPATLASESAKRTGEPVKFLEVTGSQGQNLRDTSGGWNLGSLEDPTLYNRSFNIPLKNLLKQVEAIKVVRGTIQLSVPTQVEILKFDQLTNGEKRTAGDVSVTLKRANFGQRTSLTFEFEGTERENVEVTAYDAGGHILKPQGTSGFSSRGKGSIGVHLKGKPVSVEVRVVAAVKQVDFPFSLPEIALESHEQMPEKIEPVQFTGSEPITFKFVKFSGEGPFPKAVFRVTNHTNKAIRYMELQLAYLDAGGKTLKETPHTHGASRELPEGHSTKEVEIMASFMPDGTKTVAATVRRVKFADASVWDRDDIFTDEHAPYVIGTAALDLTRDDRLRVGYVGLDRSGTPQGGMAGVTRLSPGDGRSRVASSTHKPRITSLTVEDATHCKFSHVKMSPGTYLVYIRRGERNCDWKWVNVEGQTKLDLQFEIHDDQTGTLEVVLSGDGKARQVELVPLDESGNTPIPDADLPKARIGYWLGTTLQPEADKAVFAGLRPGRYRVIAGDSHKDVEVRQGETVSATVP